MPFHVALRGALQRQRRGVFDGLDEALKLLKKRGAHPDVFRGSFPDESKVNEANLPALERFLHDFKQRDSKSSHGDDIAITLYLQGAEERPEEVAVTLSPSASTREMKGALVPLFKRLLTEKYLENNKFLQSLTQTSSDVKIATVVPKPTLEAFVRIHLQRAKQMHKTLDATKLSIKHNVNELRTLHSIDISRDEHDVPDTEYLEYLIYLCKFFKTHHYMRDAHISITKGGKGRGSHGICYASADGAVDNIGTVTLSTAHLFGEGQTRSEYSPNFANWKTILTSVDWVRLAASYAHKVKTFDSYWKGMKNVCTEVASAMNMKSVVCQQLGPLSDKAVITRRDIEILRKNSPVHMTAHDFTAAAFELHKHCGSVSTHLTKAVPPLKRMNVFSRQNVTLCLRPHLDENECRVILRGEHFIVLHTGMIVVQTEGLPEKGKEHPVVGHVYGAVREGALRAAFSASELADAEKVVAKMARQDRVFVAPQHAWMLATQDFVTLYKEALLRLEAARGRILSLRMTGLNIEIGDAFDYIESTGVLVIPYDFTVETRVPSERLPAAVSTIEK